MSAGSGPEVPTTPVVVHVDDIAWTPVQRQRNADGTESVIRERWPIIRPGFLSAYVHYEPGMVVRRHGHRSNHVVILLDGDAEIAGRACAAGTHVHVPLGAAFGPLIAGPAGVTCWELSFGEFGGWGDEGELYDAAVAARGVTPLPDPPIDLGDWFVDPRGDTGAVRPTPRVPGLSEVVTRFDELPVHEVAPGVRMARAVSEPTFTSSRIDLDPGAVLHLDPPGPHRLILITAGATSADGRDLPAGTHVEVPAGQGFGPLTGGATGARILTLTDG